MAENQQFWQVLSLEEMSRAQWESLCDGCGRCCLHKIEDEDTNEIYFTDVACHYLDEQTCQCPHYDKRQTLVPECLTIYPDWGDKFAWLPKTCAYRLLSDGKDLPVWHPLVSGNAQTVPLAGISVRGRTYRDNEIDEKDFFKHVITWVD